VTPARLLAVPFLVASSILAAPLAAQNAQRPALERLATARAAIGGAAALATVRTLRLKVHDRDRMGTWFPDKTTGPRFEQARSEILVVLPDHFLVVTQRLSAQLPDATNRWGFAGAADLRASPSSRATLGHLMLAMLLKTDTLFPFVLRDARGDRLSFSDPYGDEVFVDLDPKTSVPQRIRYDDVIRNKEGQPTGQRRPRRIELGGYAPVGRLRLPHTRTTYQGETLLQERQFESIEINPTLNPTDFR
jgi:hypothetical protein